MQFLAKALQGLFDTNAFTTADWHKINGYLVKKQPLGSGAYGTVFEAKKDNKVYAIKKIPIRSPQHLAQILHQIQIMSSLQSPNIVKIFQSFKQSDQYVYIVMQKCDNSLDQLLPMYKSDAMKIQISEKVLEAVSYVHGKKITHRDLKPENILVMDGQVKISDFGLSRHIPVSGKMISQVGSFQYKAPELINQEKYDERVDSWALGLILLEIWLGKRISEIYKGIAALSKDDFPSPQLLKSINSEPIRNIIQKLLLKDPQKRIKVAEAYKQFLKNKHEQSLLPAEYQKLEQLLKMDQERINKPNINFFSQKKICYDTEDYDQIITDPI